MKKPKIETLTETVKISIDAIENLLDEIFLRREENEKIKKQLRSVKAKLKRLDTQNGRK